MPSCRLFGSSRTVHIAEQHLAPVVNSHLTWQAHVVSSLETAAQSVLDSSLEDAPDFADRPYTVAPSTHIYVAHLIGHSFAFEMGNPRFEAHQFLQHLRGMSYICDRVIFASCLAFTDVWRDISDMRLGPNLTGIMAVLVCAKLDVNRPLVDISVMLWLSTLDWTRHLLGLGPMNVAGGVVPEHNLKWRWMML